MVRLFTYWAVLAFVLLEIAAVVYVVSLMGG